MFEYTAETVSRRRVLLAVPLAAAGAWAAAWNGERLKNLVPIQANVSVVEYDDAGRMLGLVTRRKVSHPDGDWRRQLTTQQYWSTRRGTTDTPFTGSYYRLEEAGLYRCVCCGNALFRAADKFESGTGWPSYGRPAAAQNIWAKTDRSLLPERTEVLCTLCDAHLGHVFDDGPPPTMARYCINESALRFVARYG